MYLFSTLLFVLCTALPSQKIACGPLVTPSQKLNSLDVLSYVTPVFWTEVFIAIDRDLAESCKFDSDCLFSIKKLSVMISMSNCYGLNWPVSRGIADIETAREQFLDQDFAMLRVNAKKAGVNVAQAILCKSTCRNTINTIMSKIWPDYGYNATSCKNLPEVDCASPY